MVARAGAAQAGPRDGVPWRRRAGTLRAARAATPVHAWSGNLGCGPSRVRRRACRYNVRIEAAIGTFLPRCRAMGVLVSKLFSSLFGGKDVRILILGLDNAGKTTILCAWRLPSVCRRWAPLTAPPPASLPPAASCADRLQVDEPITTVPTIGFNVETLQYKNIKFQVWDLGGQTSIRPYWRCYYPNTDAIIFVVDSADPDRLRIAKQELWGMLEVRPQSSALPPPPRWPPAPAAPLACSRFALYSLFWPRCRRWIVRGARRRRS